MRRRFLCIALLLPLLMMGAGCATTTDNESELPWNTPQSWEGSPMIPSGFGSQ